ncbi:MAG: DUF975 family protein [Ruminococcus sp.]|nr:DUF975 family protein [Ruminococcus sp.]
MNYTLDRATIKENAKAQLGKDLFGNIWFSAVLAVLIYNLIMGVLSIIPTVGSLAALVVTGPLAVGISMIFMKLARNHNKVEVGDLFFSFSDRFGKDFGLGFMVSLFTTLWALLFIVPGIVKAYSYSMAYYISLDHPDWTWNQCIKESMRITKGHKGELFVLDLSFIGWYIVGALCLGFGTFWVMAYHMTAQANYYEALKAAAGPAYNQQPMYGQPMYGAPQQPYDPSQYNQPMQ